MNRRKNQSEPDPEPIAPEAAVSYMELDRARRLLLEQATRGRTKADRTRALSLYMTLIASAS